MFSFRLFSAALLTATLLSLMFLAPATTWAQSEIPRPRLWAVYPPGAQTGQTAEIRIADSTDLYGVDRLIFSHPGITAKRVMAPADRFYPAPHVVVDKFNVTVAANTPEGVYEVRAAGPFGVSNSRRFVVSSHPFQLEEEDNNALTKANALQRQGFVAGMFNADYDYYRFAAKAGETLAIECLGQRIDSRGDPVLSLLDKAGREIARSHDVARRDPRIVYRVKSAGEFYLRVNELTHTADGGAGVSPYLLRVTTSPVIAFIEPAFAQRGGSRKFTLYGHNLGGKPTTLPAENGAPLEKIEVNINLPAAGAAAQSTSSTLIDVIESKNDFFIYRHKTAHGLSNPVSIALFNSPPQFEKEPNNHLAESTAITLPAEITGKFDSASDRDSYRFQAKKGDRLWIEVDSHRLGQPTDAVVVVQLVTQDKDGAFHGRDLKTFDDLVSPAGNFRLSMASTDPAAEFIAPEDGDYRVLVRDQFNGSPTGQPCVYRLCVRKPQPDFRLVAGASLQFGQNGNNNGVISPRACVLPPGGAVEVLVIAHRIDGYQGEIEVHAGNLPAGVTASPAIIGPQETMTAIVLRASASAAPFCGGIEVTGKATINGATKTATARALDILWDIRGNTPVTARLTQNLMLTISPSLKPAGRIEPVENKVWKTCRGGKLEIPVKLTKLRDDYSGNATAFVLGMPRLIGAPNVSIPVGGKGTVKIDVNQTAPAGKYTFHLRADAQVDHTRFPSYFASVEADRKRITETVAAVGKESSAAAANRAKIDRDLRTAATAISTANTLSATAIRTAQSASLQLAQANNAQKKLAAAAAMADAAVETAKKKLADAKEDARKAAQAELTQKTQVASQRKTALAAGAAVVKRAEEAAKKATGDVEARKAAVGEATSRRDQLQKDRAAALTAEQDAAKLKTQGDALRREIDALYNRLRNLAQKRKVKVFVHSPSIAIDIAPYPAVVTLPRKEFTLQAGGDKQPIEFTVKRDFGFEEVVTFRLTPPAGVGGLALTSGAKIEKGKPSGKFELSAASSAKPGEYEAKILCQMRINNRTLEDVRTIRLVVQPPVKKK